MRHKSLFLAGLACLLLCAPRSRAEAPPSPLRLIPAEADLLVEFKSVRQLHDLILDLDVVKELRKFPNTREFFNSTQARRFFQLLAYYEKELGQQYPDLLEQLTGGGVALGVKLGPNPGPLLLVVQGKDEKLTKQFTEMALKVIEQEFQRQEAKQKVEKITADGTEFVKIGDLLLTTVGSTILLSNNDVALHKALALARGKGGKSLADVESVREAYRLLPGGLLTVGWLNMETIRKAPGAADFYKTPRDAGLSITFGSYVDVLGRAPFVCFGLARTSEGILTTIRLPRGREGMGAELALHMPTDAKLPGSRPLLAPKGVLYSDSNYLDLARIWEDREKLFNKQAVKAMEDFNKNTGRFPLPGLQLSKLLTTAGTYHRTVVVNQPKAGYKTQPKTSIPAFALLFEMRDPKTFSQTLEAVLRAAALFAGNQAGLKLTEEKYRDLNLVGYRFPEDRPLRQDVNDVRFNFSPCFCRVGNQFVLCSTIELGRELIDLLQAEAQGPIPAAPATSRTRIYSSGIAEILQLFEDQLVTQAILDQAVPANEAREQVKAFIELVRRQGTLNLDITFQEKQTSLDIRIKTEKTK